ncbi:hypothetical protein [Yoonia sp. 208BN28-4]|uniref:hypothetical protein n=1 Tax=Yoonia sp. 208BN28-4 TaxID=3126505 RepID=UPI0030ACABC5
MPRQLFFALLLTVIAAAAVTVWIASGISTSTPTWVILIPLAAFVLVRIITRLRS